MELTQRAPMAAMAVWEATEVAGDQVSGDALVFPTRKAAARRGTVNGLGSAVQVYLLFFFG